MHQSVSLFRRKTSSLTDRFFYDCLWPAEARSKKGKLACGVYLPEIEQPRPPDAPPGMVKLLPRQESLSLLIWRILH